MSSTSPLSDDATIDSFVAAMAMGRAMRVYATESNNREISNKLSMSQFGDSNAQAPLIRADSAQESAQSLMTTGLSYMTKAIQKLNQRVRNSGFYTDDAAIGTVLELLVCEILTSGTLRGEMHCRGRYFESSFRMRMVVFSAKAIGL
jgi:hypothetical protein